MQRSKHIKKNSPPTQNLKVFERASSSAIGYRKAKLKPEEGEGGAPPPRAAHRRLMALWIGPIWCRLTNHQDSLYGFNRWLEVGNNESFQAADSLPRSMRF